MKFISMKALSTAAAVAMVSAIAVAANPAQAFKVSSGPLPTQTSAISLLDFESLPTRYVPDPDDGDVGSDAPLPFTPSTNPQNGGGTLFDTTSGGGRVFLQSSSAIGGPGASQVLFPFSATPAGSTGKYLTVAGSNATFSFDQSQKYFGLLWGSIDADTALDNVIEFFNGATSVAKLSGLDIVNAIQGTPLAVTPGDRTRYVEFYKTDFTGNFFNKVVLTNSGGNYFEVDNVAYQVPTPALLPGLIGLGVAALRKRKQQAKQEAEA